MCNVKQWRWFSFQNKTVQASLNFPENSTVTGNCSMSPLVMTVEYRKGFELAIKFGSDKDNIWWSEAITTVDYSDTFVFPNISGIMLPCFIAFCPRSRITVCFLCIQFIRLSLHPVLSRGFLSDHNQADTFWHILAVTFVFRSYLVCPVLMTLQPWNCDPGWIKLRS